MRKTYLVVLGSVIVVAGLAMLLLPGPGLLVIALGLTTLASAGVLWAARLLVRTRDRLPDAEDGSGKPGLGKTMLISIDRRMGRISAVREVRRQDRLAREAAWREQLVTTDLDTLPGSQSVDDIKARGSADTAHRRLV